MYGNHAGDRLSVELLFIRFPLRIFLTFRSFRIQRVDGVGEATSVGIHRASCVQTARVRAAEQAQ